MTMTSKERMLTALKMGKPDRVPATIHQWQSYHLKYFMGGVSAIEAFREVGLDAAITIYTPPIPSTPSWKISEKSVVIDGEKLVDYLIETPEGNLSYQVGYNEMMSWVTVPLIKKDEDIQLLKKYRPIPKLDKNLIEKTYDEVGDDGIIRTFVFGEQAGCWQDACVLYGTEQMIYATFDKPEWVHEFLNILVEQKQVFIEESLRGAKIDLIETGGGASSNNVISPKIHEEFCLPYDLKMHTALKDAGHISAYHTCGGMMKILDLIAKNGCTASETLSPPGVGGDITEPHLVKQSLGKKVSLIGGLDQFNVLTSGSEEEIRKEVIRLFEAYGKDGGYIMSACDHFFDTPKANMIAYAKAAKECVY